VCGWGLSDSEDTIEILVGLVGNSLVLTDRHDGAMRYRLLETLREYAQLNG
jgi:hypothetical protein